MSRIGLVQAAACHDISVNLDAVGRFAREAATLGCEVLCFPECFLTGYAPGDAGTLSVCTGSPHLLRISGIAGECGVDLLVGFMERADDAFYITHGIFRRDGSREFYRKTHLGRKESRYFAPGDALKVYSLSSGLRIGFQLCVETHYPEITQTLALKGAEVVFAPHAVPRVSGERQRIWEKFIPARSYDNRVYMACCNLWDPDRFSGGCLVTDPGGETVSACYEAGARLLTCEIHRELVTRYRTPGNTRAARFYPSSRPELYTDRH